MLIQMCCCLPCFIVCFHSNWIIHLFVLILFNERKGTKIRPAVKVNKEKKNSYYILVKENNWVKTTHSLFGREGHQWFWFPSYGTFVDENVLFEDVLEPLIDTVLSPGSFFLLMLAGGWNSYGVTSETSKELLVLFLGFTDIHWWLAHSFKYWLWI